MKECTADEGTENGKTLSRTTVCWASVGVVEEKPWFIVTDLGVEVWSLELRVYGCVANKS